MTSDILFGRFLDYFPVFPHSKTNPQRRFELVRAALCASHGGRLCNTLQRGSTLLLYSGVVPFFSLKTSTKVQIFHSELNSNSNHHLFECLVVLIPSEHISRRRFNAVLSAHSLKSNIFSPPQTLCNGVIFSIFLHAAGSGWESGVFILLLWWGWLRRFHRGNNIFTVSTCERRVCVRPRACFLLPRSNCEPRASANWR